MDWKAILQHPRWEPLERFVARWYAEPLGETGLRWEDVGAVESKLGCKFPLAVREWYTLVGHRFDDVNQDRPVRLSEQRVDDGRIGLWTENQGNWNVEVVADDGEEDPPISVEGEVFSPPDSATASEALLGMVYSDTLVGVWAGCGVGPLGSLRDDVGGGHARECGSGFEDRLARIPSLAVFRNPYFELPLRGHDTFVIRAEGGCEWMAATPEAEAEAMRLIGLDEASATFILVLVFAGIDALGLQAVSAMQNDHENRLSDGLARLRMTSGDGGSGLALEFETHDPLRAFDAIKGNLRPALLGALSAGYRLEHVMRFTPCWPPEAKRFAQPR